MIKGRVHYEAGHAPIGCLMRILFAGHFEWNCGSTQTVKEYIEAGTELGLDICLSDLGPIDHVTASHLPVVDSFQETDVLVFVFESDQFMDESRLQRVLRKVPRRRRLVIDTDGHNRNLVRVGSDANHRSIDELIAWREIFDELSDTVLEPALNSTGSSQRFLFWGMSPQCKTLRREDARPLDWDLGYIGNNWYRWADLVWLLRGIEGVRHMIPRIGIRGMWWGHECLSGFQGAADATASDPRFLADQDVDCGPSVPFGMVIESMSRARVHPVLVRPVLHHMNFVTPRMFETFASRAIPALAPYLEYTRALYGEDARLLVLGDDPTERLVEMTTRPWGFQELLLHLREELHRKHSYQMRIAELLQFLE